MMNETVKRILKLALPLVVICIVSGAALTATDNLTRAKIEAAEQAAINEALLNVFPSASFDGMDSYYIATINGEKIGYAFIAEGLGYSDTIETMVGMYQNGTISHIYVISQKETPGLGTKITETEFLAQFSGKRVDSIRLTKDRNATGAKGAIDAITAATISSRAITNSIHDKMEEVINETQTR
jgi:electron transport complex protein RnfG